MNALVRIGLACGFLAAGVFAAGAEPSGPLVDVVPSITVEGVAKREVVPDLAVVTLGVVTDRPAAAQASADNARAAAALVATARAAGLQDGDIRTSALRLETVTDQRDSSKVKAFRASNQVALRLHDLGRVGSLIGQLTAGGANSIDGITFSIDDPRPVLDELRATATEDATRKAGIYARAAGVKIGRLLRIAPETAGDPGPTPRAYKLQMAVPAPAPPVEAGTEALEVRVQLTWELVP